MVLGFRAVKVILTVPEKSLSVNMRGSPCLSGALWLCCERDGSGTYPGRKRSVMRCFRCETPVGGLLGALRARAVECPNAECEVVYCVNCLPQLAHSFEEGFGPLRRGVLELRCDECDTVIQRTEFRSELEMAARDAVSTGAKRVKTLLARRGIEQILRRRPVRAADEE